MLYVKSHLLTRIAGLRFNDPFVICADEWLRAVIADRHTFYDASWAPRNLIRLMRQTVISPASAESEDSLCRISNVFRGTLSGPAWPPMDRCRPCHVIYRSIPIRPAPVRLVRILWADGTMPFGRNSTEPILPGLSGQPWENKSELLKHAFFLSTKRAFHSVT